MNGFIYLKIHKIGIKKVCLDPDIINDEPMIDWINIDVSMSYSLMVDYDFIANKTV